MRTGTRRTDLMCSSRKEYKAKMMNRPSVWAAMVAAKEWGRPVKRRRAPCFTPTITKCMKLWGACVVLIHPSQSTEICQSHTWGKYRKLMFKLPIGWHLSELRFTTAMEEHRSTIIYFSCAGTTALHALSEIPFQFFLWTLQRSCGLCWIWASHGEYKSIFSCTNKS